MIKKRRLKHSYDPDWPNQTHPRHGWEWSFHNDWLRDRLPKLEKTLSSIKIRWYQAGLYIDLHPHESTFYAVMLWGKAGECLRMYDPPGHLISVVDKDWPLWWPRCYTKHHWHNVQVERGTLTILISRQLA